MDVNLFVRQFWRDHRLDLSLNRSEWKAFGIEAFKDIWVPEVYFPAAKKGKWHDLMKPNTALHIHHGGEIFLSRGASQTIYCPMDLRNFPFDQQRCQMDIRLYAYDNKHCTLDWNLERGGPIFVNNDLQVSEFSVKSMSYSKSVVNVSKSASYDVLSTTFILERQRSFYLLNYIFPCGMIVILSWVGFWIDYRSTPARASLGITTVLTITTLTNSIRAAMPQVVYTKAIDVYLLTCFVFVFASIIEFAIVGITDVKWQKSYKKKRRKMKEKEKRADLNEEIPMQQLRKQPGKRDASQSHSNSEAHNETLGDEICHSSISLHAEVSAANNTTEIKRRNIKTKNVETKDKSAMKRSTTSNKNCSCCLLVVWRKIVDYLAEKHTKTRNHGHIIDRLSRVIFPILFFIFNVLFFTTVYLKGKNTKL
ncbi:gamma-aminobutyric acid receptor subunit beta-like isoform X2 [Rhopilema esculentum]